MRCPKWASAATLAAVADATIPNLDKLAPRPAFRDGLPGSLQLILLACLSARLRRPGS